MRSSRAVAIGCRAVAWWLHRHAGKVSVRAAGAVGVVSRAAAYFGGPGLAGSVLSLLAFFDLAG